MALGRRVLCSLIIPKVGVTGVDIGANNAVRGVEPIALRRITRLARVLGGDGSRRVKIDLKNVDVFGEPFSVFGIVDDDSLDCLP